MFCHNNMAFLFCLPKRCSWSRLKKGGSGQQKSWLRLHPKSGGSSRLRRNTAFSSTLVDRQGGGGGGELTITRGWGEAWRGERADGLEKSANARIAQ